MYREADRHEEPEPTSVPTPSAGPRYWIQTDLTGTIIDLSPDAAALLGFRRNGVVGRSFPHFIGQDRHEVVLDMRRTHTSGRPVLSQRVLRGKGRKGAWVRVQIQTAEEPGELVWILWM